MEEYESEHLSTGSSSAFIKVGKVNELIASFLLALQYRGIILFGQENRMNAMEYSGLR
jgi:hypothetical protein